MALTPEDVVNKRFQPTKFREGYDQDEVDDFLDEIVVELRRLTQENEELRRRLGEAGSSAGEQAVPAPVAAAPAAKTAEAEKPKAKEAEVKKEETPAAAAPKAAEPAKVVAAAPAATTSTAESAAGVLAMAQRLHDEYVSAGVEQRDKIIAEAQVEANSLVSDAEEKSRKTLSALEQQKTVLERKVEQLRGFERDYRARLKTYIEGQLRDLEAKGSMDTAESKDNG
ncbi:cell division protein [Arthrobacter sp. MYb227]|uniref:DivIVA domain-containing protein n=1 Tax=Arthrobacter sp. MYb227 TaxID=1848601 RepID=UPI000CFDC609|nr:DivIVA domain-containing protein [Arthrobacter sp. MYb227]PQZ95867.1 cell division protein [Arthrobacter sp. MYb227]